MEHRANDQAPDASTLWLAIGIGGFSVLASFLLAIYFAAMSTGSEATSVEAQKLEVSTSPAN
ncbi:MAG: hypothetical protein ABJ205_12365 [Erythrobacter sp.]|uniref:hypothetical protein n=1 Tax=Erythrobacter sp. TaxID=1042 RepID=UPI003263B59E